MVVLAHSGSRCLGAALAATWAMRTLRGDDRDRYLGELAGACRFARTNRLILTYRLLSALGALRYAREDQNFTVRRQRAVAACSTALL